MTHKHRPADCPQHEIGTSADTGLAQAHHAPKSQLHEFGFKSSSLQAEQISNLAVLLATWADAIGGGDPVVSIIDNEVGPFVLWQYAKQDVIVKCFGTDVVRGPTGWGSETPLLLALPSLQLVFELLRQTELIRQPITDCPYIRLGPIPGTVLDAVDRFHFP
ncbi:hypothetical protein GJ698_06505 [Pseudoduganella sp. FT26W]|uniref:Uncharacterized protein n=1 Tax=Duganella aquatilis TaxID=2666082 RepID=A0A844D9N4_9BURK|nr:hypothetical protein [Duganella aquatilis]MRW83744.1 hypothetical protein [Duganella aquatilis]